ncbi:unnamed protein product [Prorocentrum cordatum]|uniref:Uncharacterized protein n=1 Tax=Prorocentrum cordatum TaxID=2364126 RepID=A0ABN9PE33_9DINO|nr:unnamed protein product [Polarella glacialis]
MNAEGVTVVARQARRGKFIDQAMSKTMERLFVAFHVTRHITTTNATKVVSKLEAHLSKSGSSSPPISTASPRTPEGKQAWVDISGPEVSILTPLQLKYFAAADATQMDENDSA